MLSVTTDFKNTIKQSAVYSDGYVEINNSDGTITFESKDLSSIEIYGSAFENNKVLGSIAQHSLTLDLLGDLTSSISLNKENIIKAYIGVRVDDTNYEYVQFQDFIVTSIVYSDTQNITRIIATDYLVKLNVEYVDDNTYPLTLKSYLENVLTSCGLELENTTFFNDDFVVDEQKIQDLVSCKEIVSKVAEMALCFARINKVSNKVELVKAFDPFMRAYTHDELSAFTHEELSALKHYDIQNAITLEDESIAKSNYWSFKLSDHWFKTYGINTLTLKESYATGESNTSERTDYTSVDGNVEVSIIDNPFINTETLRLSVIESMLDEIVGYKYNPYTLEYRGFPYLEVGDIVDITRLDETSFGSPIYEMTIRYDGGLYGKLAAQALSQTETTYYNTQTLAQRVKTAEVIVNKVDGEVTIMAGDYYDGKLVGTYYNFDGEGFSMTNSSDETVFSADSNGNLTFIGKVQGIKDNILRVELDEDSLIFNDESSNSVGYIKSYTSGSSRIFSISDDGVTYGIGYRLEMEKIFTNTYIGRMIVESETNNYARVSVQSIAGDLYPEASLESTVSPSANVLQWGKVSGGANQSFIGNNQITLSPYNVDYYAFIRTYANGTIEFNSSTQNYKIYIGGGWKTISVDGSGFLKAT